MSPRQTLGVHEALLTRWSNPTAKPTRRAGAEPGARACGRAYVREFIEGGWLGTPVGCSFPALIGKRVVELGHGGIRCCLASLGAFATAAGFTVASFQVHGTWPGRLALTLAPRPAATPLLDMLSTGAATIPVKDVR